MPSYHLFSKIIRCQHLRRVRQDGHHYFVWSCFPQCSYGPVPAYRSLWKNREAGLQFLFRGKLIRVTSFPQRGREPARTSEEGHGAEPSQISFPRKRARHLRIVSSKEADVNTHKEFGKRDIAILFEVVVQNTFTVPHLRTAEYGKTEVGPSFSSEGNLSSTRTAHCVLGNRKGEIRAELSQISSLSYRKQSLLVVSLKVADINI